MKRREHRIQEKGWRKMSREIKTDAGELRVEMNCLYSSQMLTMHYA